MKAKNETYTFVDGGNLLCLDSDSEWLDLRKSRITGSAVASIMGLSPWRSRDDLLGDIREPTEFVRKPAMWWGSYSEQHNMQAFSDITGLPVQPHNGFYESKATPLLASTLDGFVWPSEALEEGAIDPLPLGALKQGTWYDDFWAELYLFGEGVGIIEMKQTSRVGEWTKRVPEYYWAQVQMQLYVTGLRWAIICAKIGAADMRFHVVVPDEFFIEAMVDEAHKFAEEAGIGNI